MSSAKLYAVHPTLADTSDAAVLIEGRGVRKTYRTQDGEVETLKPLDFSILSLIHI